MQTETIDWRYTVSQVIVCPSLIYGFRVHLWYFQIDAGENRRHTQTFIE